MKPTNLRPTADARSCGNCLLFKSYDQRKNIDPGSPLVTVSGDTAGDIYSDGICEAFGDTPVLKTQICDGYIPL